MSNLMLLLLFFIPLTIGNPVKVLTYKNSVKTIVKDLIDNWQSPIVYLKSRGYFPKNLGDGSELDFDNFVKNMPEEMVHSEQDQRVVVSRNSQGQTVNKQDTELFDENKSNIELKETKTESNLVDEQNDKFLRVTRSFEDTEDTDLKNMFHTLFSTDDNKISDEIKTKLHVPWDMNALKLAVRREANKHYKKFCNKRNEKYPHNLKPNDTGKIDVSVAEQVAQYYPSVVGSPDMHWDIKNKDLVMTSAYKKPNFLKGIAKILGSRELMIMSKTAAPFHNNEHAKMQVF